MSLPGKNQGGDATRGLCHHEFAKIVIGRDEDFIGVPVTDDCPTPQSDVVGVGWT